MINYNRFIQLKKNFKYVLIFLVLITNNQKFGQTSCSDSFISRPSEKLIDEKPEAYWIWDNSEISDDYHLLIRKVFTLDDKPVKASVYISAYSFADVYINGKLLDRCPVNCDPEFQVYENYEISEYLSSGTNIISAHVYNYGIGLHHRLKGRGGFFFQGKIELENAAEKVILSDKSWKVFHPSAWENTGKLRSGNGEKRPNLIGFNERFNSNLMPDNWLITDFNDSNWENAYEIGIPPINPWNSIVSVKRPPLARIEITPIKHWRTKNADVFDFGKEITGHPKFEIKSKYSGVCLEIGTGERLESDSTVNSTKRINFTDEYITKIGVQNWSPSTWRGFRYFSIQRNDSVEIIKVSAISKNYDFREEGSFECSDSLLNKIWDIGRNSVKLCSQDTYMDTPWREQTQYIAGDSRYLQNYSFYSFGCSSNFLAKYNLLSGAESQRWSNDGAIRTRYPTDWLLGVNSSTYLFDYEIEWIIMLGEYYNYFGDKDFIKQVYPNMLKLLDYIEKFVEPEHGLIKDAPGWIVLDHPDTYPMDQKEEITGLNCLYYKALLQSAFLSKSVLNNENNYRKFTSKAEEIKSNVNKWLWDPNKKLYKDSFGSNKYSQQTQVYALLYGLVEDSLKTDLVNYIVQCGRNSEQSFAYYVLKSVFDYNPVWAVNYIREYWGAQIQSPLFNGAWHEAWNVDVWTSDQGSTSHAWSSGPTALLPQKVLGAEPLENGWKYFKIQPNTADLSWAKGIVPTPNGKLNIEWKNLPDELLLDLTIPENSEAIVIIPSTNKTIKINGADFLDLNINNSFDQIENKVKFKLTSGSYKIISNN